MKQYTYNLKLEHTASKFKAYKITEQPPSCDLRSKCPAVYDQLQIGSCTANALVAAYEFDDMSLFGSRLFLYYNERLLDNDISQDAGSTLSQGINALVKYGVCHENLWTYVDDGVKYKTKPTDGCYTDAKSHEIVTYNNVPQNLTSMKQCLLDGFPFVVGISIYESFESDTVAHTGIVPMPQSTEKELGGHAVMCVGYDNSKNCFIMRNSWGTGWGDKGYFYIPYDYLTNTTLTGDLWEIKKVMPDSEPNPPPNPPPIIPINPSSNTTPECQCTIQ